MILSNFSSIFLTATMGEKKLFIRPSFDSMKETDHEWMKKLGTYKYNSMTEIVVQAPPFGYNENV